MNNCLLKIYSMNKNIKEPLIKGDSNSVDLYTYEDTIVPARSRVVVPTGLRIKIPDGYFGQVSSKYNIDVFGCNGCYSIEREEPCQPYLSIKPTRVDNEICDINIVVYNEENYPILITDGLNIAQLIIYKKPKCQIQHMTIEDNELDFFDGEFNSFDKRDKNYIQKGGDRSEFNK